MENGIAVPRKSKYQMQRVMVKTSKHIQVIIESVYISIFLNIRHIGVYNIYICSGDITYQNWPPDLSVVSILISPERYFYSNKVLNNSHFFVLKLFNAVWIVTLATCRTWPHQSFA